MLSPDAAVTSCTLTSCKTATLSKQRTNSAPVQKKDYFERVRVTQKKDYASQGCGAYKNLYRRMCETP